MNVIGKHGDEMKTRTDAAKILLDAGWEIDEVNAVLGTAGQYVIPMPYQVPAFPLYPSWPFTFTDGTSTKSTTDSITITCTDSDKFTVAQGMSHVGYAQVVD